MSQIVQGTIVNSEPKVNSLFSVRNISDNLAAARDNVTNPSLNFVGDIASLGSKIANGVGNLIGRDNATALSPAAVTKAWTNSGLVVPA